MYSLVNEYRETADMKVRVQVLLWSFCTPSSSVFEYNAESISSVCSNTIYGELDLILNSL